MAKKCIMFTYVNGIKDFCTIKKIRIMIKNLVNPKPHTNENVENIGNLAHSDHHFVF